MKTLKLVLAVVAMAAATVAPMTAAHASKPVGCSMLSC